MPIERDIRGRTQFLKLRHARMLKFRDAMRLLRNLARSPYVWTHDEGVTLIDDMQTCVDEVRKDFEMSNNWDREKLPRGTTNITR